MKTQKKNSEDKYFLLWRILFGILILTFAVITFIRLNYPATILYILISVFVFIPGSVFRIEKNWIKIVVVIVAIICVGLLNHFTVNQEDKSLSPSELELPSDISSINLIAENILQSINSNNYALFKKDFSDNLVNLIPEQKFIEIRNLILETSGEYISKLEPKLYELEGELIYEYPCVFEKENVTLDISFSQNSEKVEGILFSSENLIKAVSN